jgi:hypothetical protein
MKIIFNGLNKPFEKCQGNIFVLFISRHEDLTVMVLLQ